MDTGKLTDFYGDQPNHSRMTPGGRELDRDDLMPIEGWSAGMTLSQFEPRYDPDPYVLYDRWGRIVKQWPDDYMPDREEIRQAVQDELKKEGRRV